MQRIADGRKKERRNSERFTDYIDRCAATDQREHGYEVSLISNKLALRSAC